MKVSDFIANFLEAQGVNYVFELAGGMITHILDSLNRNKNINVVSMHHEQGAAFAAEGFARVKGVPGVAMATSGPGATNMLTAIGSCYFDSVPAVFITGQVNTHELRGDRKIRQLGFQETDIISMAKPITKETFMVTKSEDIQSIFEKAFEIALSGRPGPVLIDIPMNIQRENIEVNQIKKVKKIIVKKTLLNDELFENLYKDITIAKKPLILVGRGVKASSMTEQFREFVTLTKIPVISTLLAVDVMSYDNQFRVGFIGSYGNRWANLSIGLSDLIIVIGSRLDIRQTGADSKFFSINRKLIHIDCEEGEINNRVTGCQPIVSDIQDFLLEVNENFKSKNFNYNSEWISEINNLKKEWPDTEEIKDIEGINPNHFMHQLSKNNDYFFGYVADVGNHQMWAAQSLEINGNQFFLTSGGMGAMGFSLPAAIGASLASNNSPVAVIVGDGSFQLNIQELQTIYRNKLPIKIIVLNNNCLGMIRQFQDSYFESKYQSTLWGYSAPNFELVAEAYGIKSKTIKITEEIDAAIKWLMEDNTSPNLLQVLIDTKANAYPKIAFGRPITEMEPFSKPLDMEGT